MSDTHGPGDKASREEKSRWFQNRLLRKLTRTRQPVTPSEALRRIRAELNALTTEPYEIDDRLALDLLGPPPTFEELLDALDCLQELVDRQ